MWFLRVQIPLLNVDAVLGLSPHRDICIYVCISSVDHPHNYSILGIK